jgi:Zn-finger nucleic acid-binding protein
MRDPASVSAMLCPVCSTGLAMAERQGVEIDYCPQCRGVWLDRGELDKIIERSAAPIPAAQPQPSFRPDRSETYGHRKRKKSFLEELFD